LDFLDSAFTADSDSDDELPDLLEISSDGSTVSTDTTASVTEPDLNFVPARAPLPVFATVASAVIPVPVSLLPVLVPPTESTDDNEPEAAVKEAFDETPTLDVSVQPPWLARLLLLLVFLLLTAFPLRSLHRDALLGTPNNGHSIFDEPPCAVRAEIWWGPPATTTASNACDATFVRQPCCNDPPMPSASVQSSSFNDPPLLFVNQTKVLELFRPLQTLCYPQLSSSAFTGGKALRAVTSVLPAGYSEPVEICAGVDTMSDVTLALRHLLCDVENVLPDGVRGTGSTTVFAEQGYLDVFEDGRVQRVPAFVATPAQLPSSCEVLLGVPAILDLGVILDEQKLHQRAPLVCHLGEKTLRAWLDTHPDESVDTKPFNIDSIDVHPDLPPHIQSRLRAIIKKHAACFEGQAGTLPKPFDAPPIELNFRPDAEPTSIPEPRWSCACKEVVQRWAEAGLQNGSLEPSKSAWASRAHIVLKPPSGVTAANADIKDCKLRVTGDYRQVNTQIQKLVPNLPTGTHQVERAAGHRYFFESDSVACYNSFILAPGRSREALAIWSPIGLVQPTVLPFGQKNSGTEAQGPYRNAAKSLRNLANYMDDWLGFSNDLDQLCSDFDKFLAVCVINNITLNTTKTRVGYSSAQFFGFTVNRDGTRLSDKHLDPLENLVPPTDIPELRRVLGLFVVSRRFIENYAMVVKPMTDILRGRHPQFSWSEPQQVAFDTARELLLGGIHLSPPDYSLPFHLATDASEDGKGGYLYQLPTIPIEDQHPYCPRKHGPDKVAIIQFLSKSWTETQRNRPPFYLEADALLWAQGKCKFYALSSPFPFYTYSDHLPLMWMQKSEKGAVSKFIIENLSELETIHQYICGPQNSIPDAASRYPMLGPKRLAPTGLAHAVQELLSRLPTAMEAANVVHAHAGADTVDVRRIIQSWRNASGSVLAVAPPREGEPAAADLAIMIPRVEAAPVALALYLLSKVPFALLLPVDLASQAYSPGLYFGSPHEEIEAAFRKAGKLTLLSPQMIWVIGNVPECAPVETFSAELRTPAPLMDLFALATTPNTAASVPSTSDPSSSSAADDSFVTDVPQTLEAWAEAQAADPDFDDFVAKIKDVAIRNELYIHAPPDRPPRILVPPSVQTPLIRHTHIKMWHLGSDKVARTLRLSYFWPTINADTKRVLADCPGCELEKARQQKAHGLFSARPYETPRTRWAMDFQGQGTSSDGMCQALGLIDTTSRFVVVIPLPNREATTLIQPYLDRVVYTHGPPVTLHSDAAPEFLDQLVQLAADATDTHTTNTLGHNAQGNAAIEIFWRFWNRCMRILPDDLYLQWPSFTSRIVYAYNSAPHTSLGGISPFEIMHGVPARNPFDVAVQAAILDAVLPTADLADPQSFADTIKVSVAAFTAHARHHSDYVRSTTADRLNAHGHATTVRTMSETE
jgi:transposase InsO family protein